MYISYLFYHSFDTSSIFHFLQIYSTYDGGYFGNFDSKYIRAYITDIKINVSYSNLELYDHWLFDKCENNIDNKNLETSLFEHVTNFTNSACIRYYYNSSQKKYYFFQEKGFIWSHLEHGLSHRENIFLTTTFQKCINNSVINKILGNCSSQEEIDKYVNRYNFLYLYFADKQIDPNNYYIPVQRYFQSVATRIVNGKTYIEHFIYFSPMKIKTNLGSLFGKSNVNDSYCFNYNKKNSEDNEESLFICAKSYHLMQNNVQIYERSYNNIFDLFSEIGSVASYNLYFIYFIG